MNEDMNKRKAQKKKIFYIIYLSIYMQLSPQEQVQHYKTGGESSKENRTVHLIPICFFFKGHIEQLCQ